jgi:hypothetical protein
MKLHGLVPNFYIHESVSDQSSADRSCEDINRSQIHECGKLGDRTLDSVLEITAVQFNFWEYINWNQTFILDSHRPFICNIQNSQKK